ncbi:D-alanine--D-alanine ligase [Roridomyces roridus]|uniref:D-alanine--D-alanine ligase n=1 Tax=Roridomyces roridus TaxID=1738132 RepID=A0AAD7BRK7_9AGAR|nr:D-alanine--D-alanine ligase [Roridomyces roridus]
MKPTRLLILAGGRSEEHQVSIASARAVLEATKTMVDIDSAVLVVARNGFWLTIEESRKALDAGTQTAESGGGLPMLHAIIAEMITDYDVVFPLMHGPFGEDGTVQGLLELAGIPYIGCGVLASAVCMDKIMTKEVLRANHVPQVRFVATTRDEYAADPARILGEVKERLDAPWFVKPANLGSSIGVSKARDEAELELAITKALSYGRRALIEESVVHVRELEVAVLGNATPEASLVGEVVHSSDFYDNEAKYGVGCEVRIRIPAHVSAAVCDSIRELALRVYKILDCAGFARVDFFYQERTGEIFLNEVNTIPGFRPTSMYPRLWEAGGVGYQYVIRQLVKLALER